MKHHWLSVPADCTPQQWDAHFAEDERLQRIITSGHRVVWVAPFEDEAVSRTRFLFVFEEVERPLVRRRTAEALWLLLAVSWVGLLAWHVLA